MGHVVTFTLTLHTNSHCQSEIPSICMHLLAYCIPISIKQFDHSIVPINGWFICLMMFDEYIPFLFVG